MRIPHDLLQRLFAVGYAALVTNALIVLATVPFLGLLPVVAAGLAGWPVLALTAPLLGPALVAAFTVFDRLVDGTGHGPDPIAGDDGPTAPWRVFGTAWRRGLRAGLGVAAVTTGALVVLGVDVAFFWGRRSGAASIPVLVVLMLLVAGTAVTALAAVAERPDLPVRRALAAGLVLGVRRWYLTAVSLTVLGLLAAFVATRPLLGLGIAAAPLLYVVRANARYALHPTHDHPGGRTAPA